MPPLRSLAARLFEDERQSRLATSALVCDGCGLPRTFDVGFWLSLTVDDRHAMWLAAATDPQYCLCELAAWEGAHGVLVSRDESALWSAAL